MLELFRFEFRLLFFRSTEEELQSFTTSHLAFGLFWTWLVGMGRWWDDPKANTLQHLGVGSLVYVFALAALLYLVMAPLRPKSWSYKNILTFVTLTAPPAIFYAIPVEQFMALREARIANISFLAVVATWRMALLFFYLKRGCRLSSSAMMVGALMPVTAIVCALTWLNLERVIVNIMAGLEPQGNANDAIYETVGVIAVLSVYAFPIALVAWIVLIVKARKRRGEDD